MDYFSSRILPEIFNMKKVSMIMMAVIAVGQLTAQSTNKLAPPPPPPVPPPAAVKMHKTPPPPMAKEVNKVQPPPPPPPPPPKPPKIHKEKVHFVAPKIVKDSTN